MAHNPEFDFEITAVDGERGRQLAKVQAAEILAVLEWFGRHTERRAEAETAQTETNPSNGI